MKQQNKGTPQGGNISPLLSNILLNELDKELEARGLHFVRYADDCVIAVKSEASAKRVMRTITNWIEKKLGLKVNMTKTHITKPDKFKISGIWILLQSTNQSMEKYTTLLNRKLNTSKTK